MTDTPETVRALYRSLILQRPGAERVKMGFDLFETSRTIVISGLRESAPDGVVTREALFLRTYGRDFDPPTRAKIASYFRCGEDEIVAPPEV